MSRNMTVYGLQGHSRDEEETSYLAGDEILGDEILGALQAATAALQQTPGFQSAMARRLAARSPIVQRVQPTKKRRWIMGFGPTAIPPASTVTIQAQPQILFRGEKILNTGDTTGLFVQGLFIGQKSQLPTFQSPISVLAFATGVLDNELMLDTCDPALFVTWQIQNIDSVTHTWHSAIVGHTVL